MPRPSPLARRAHTYRMLASKARKAGKTAEAERFERFASRLARLLESERPDP